MSDNIAIVLTVACICLLIVFVVWMNFEDDLLPLREGYTQKIIKTERCDANISRVWVKE
jgi:hypothetical protein